MKQDNSTPAPFDRLFEQMANISKSTAYDVLVEQVKELKSENDKLRRDKTDLLAALEDVSPLLDGLINRTESGLKRNELCDMNIKVKTALANIQNKYP